MNNSNLDFLREKKGNKDIAKIIFYNDKVIKYFKRKKEFYDTLNFYDDFKNVNFLPKLFNINENNLSITVEHAGDLLTLNSMPNDWESQIKTIKKHFIKKKLCILDIRPDPFNPFIINNICVKNNKLYLIDCGLCLERSKIYILYKINLLIYLIKIYSFFKDNYLFLYTIHFCFELFRLVIIETIEKIFFKDIRFIF